MKFVLFDAIMEMHVVSSLERALVERGHEVYSTGKLAHGHTFITETVDIYRVNKAIEKVEAFAPDVVLVFRPSSLPIPLLHRLKSVSIQTMAWFSDDPVLWNLSYGPVLDFYDAILHCGDRRVLSFYEKKAGRPTGVNFPFWSDTVEFPYVYGSKPIESDVLFLGNVGDKVRRRRYFELAQCALDVRIHGKVGDDYFGLSAGYLDTPAEIKDAGARSRLALNVPQIFADHRNAPTWFDGLGELGCFQLPSRVVQCAGLGLPMVSLLPEGEASNVFPEIPVVHSLEALEARCQDLLRSEELADLSRATRKRFERQFTAASRAMALESLARSDDWRALDAGDRAEWFAQFEAPTVLASKEATLRGSPQARLEISAAPAEAQFEAHLVKGLHTTRPRRVAVVGQGRGDHFSPLRVAARALRFLGHAVVDVLPEMLKPHTKPDPLGEYSGVVDLDGLHASLGGGIDAFMFVGTSFLVCPQSLAWLRRRVCVSLIVHGIPDSEYSRRLARLVVQADQVSFLDPTAPEAFAAAGTPDYLYLPHLVDRDYLRLFARQEHRYPRVTVLAEHSSDLEKYQDLIDGFAPADVKIVVAAETRSRPHALGRLARAAFSTLVCVLPPTGRRAPNHQWLGHALFAGALTVHPRHESIPRARLNETESFILADSAREVRQKIARLRIDPERVKNIRGNSLRLATSRFAAEEQIAVLLGDR